jgi:hypothetical protein
MRHRSRLIVWSLLWLVSTPLMHSQNQRGPRHNRLCNQNGTLCVNTAVEQSVVQNPFYFEVQVKCPAQIVLAWELRDDSGQILDKDPDGRLAFLLNSPSASERTLAVRDFALGPPKTCRGKLVLRARTYSISGENHAVPELSIPLSLDTRTTSVSYAVPAGDEFSRAVIDSVESDPAHRVPMRAEVDWRTTTLLFVQPTMLGGVAAEAAARAYPGQGPWHVINYSQAQGTAHLTTMGDGWAGVTYYLTGLHYLLEKTVEHQPGMRRVVYDKPPDFAR